ncbi:unnamed protein product [Absidia cylindrospora]
MTESFDESTLTPEQAGEAVMAKNSNAVEAMDEGSPESRLLEAKDFLESLRMDAVLARSLHHEAVKNNLSKKEQMSVLKNTAAVWEEHALYKSLVHKEFPTEKSFFPDDIVNIGTGANPNILTSMPCIIGFKEKAREPHGDLHHHVKPFLQDLEGYFTSLSMNIETEFLKYMDVTLGGSFKHYIHRKLEGTSSKSAGWTQVKEWLYEFVDTPKQKVKDINEFLKLTPKAGETIEAFSRRLCKMGDNMEVQAISVQELMFMTTISRMPILWQEKILNLVYSSKQKVMKSNWSEFCTFLGNVDVEAVTPHAGHFKRQLEASDELMKSKHASASAHRDKRRASPSVRMCNRNCGQPYVHGHNSNNNNNGSVPDKRSYSGLSTTHKATRSLVKTTLVAHISDRAVSQVAKGVQDCNLY